MIIHVKNKNTLIIDDFKLKCCIGRNSLNYDKKEGDYSTPKGIFNLKKLYFRKERVGIPKCKIDKKIIKKNMAWCDDPNHKKYNEEIKTRNESLRESLYRKDHKYDYIITINYNEKKIPSNIIDWYKIFLACAVFCVNSGISTALKAPPKSKFTKRSGKVNIKTIWSAFALTP